jgi:hypothetical protein
VIEVGEVVRLAGLGGVGVQVVLGHREFVRKLVCSGFPADNFKFDIHFHRRAEK